MYPPEPFLMHAQTHLFHHILGGDKRQNVFSVNLTTLWCVWCWGVGEVCFLTEKNRAKAHIWKCERKQKQKQKPLFFKPLWGFQNSKDPIMLSLYFKMQSKVWKHITLHGFNKKNFWYLKRNGMNWFLICWNYFW